MALALSGTALAAAKWNIKFGHDQPEKSPHHDGALFFKKLVEEGSNGEIAVKIFPSQLLGTGLQMSEMVQAGALQILAIPTSNMQVLHPSLQVLDLPFLFPDKEALFKVLDSDFTDSLYKPLLSRNIVGLHWIISGFKQFTDNFPIRTPDDFKGRKIRVIPAPIIREQFKALGASPVPIDFHANENTNGLIRQHLPKKSRMDQLTQDQADHIERRLNHRPRKCLGYLTPHEVFNDTRETLTVALRG